MKHFILYLLGLIFLAFSFSLLNIRCSKISSNAPIPAPLPEDSSHNFPSTDNPQIVLPFIQIKFDNYYCNQYAQDSIIITKVVSKSAVPSNLVIPDSINHILVVGLGKSLFENHTSLNSVTMNSVIRIDSSVFKGCTALTNVIAPKVSTVSFESFLGCYNLNSVSMNKVKTISNRAFYNCGKLSTIFISGVLSIGNDVFWGVKNTSTGDGGACPFTAIFLPNVTSIGSRAFSETKITDLICPKLESVGKAAFLGSSVTTIYLPVLTSISEMAFENCTSLNTMNTTLAFPQVTTVGVRAFAKCTSLETLAFPSATEVGDEFATECAGLKNIILPKCEIIGKRAFKLPNNGSPNTNLLTADLTSIKEIKEEAFHNVWICNPTTVKNLSTTSIIVSPTNSGAGFENSCLFY